MVRAGGEDSVGPELNDAFVDYTSIIKQHRSDGASQYSRKSRNRSASRASSKKANKLANGHGGAGSGSETDTPKSIKSARKSKVDDSSDGDGVKRRKSRGSMSNGLVAVASPDDGDQSDVVQKPVRPPRSASRTSKRSLRNGDDSETLSPDADAYANKPKVKRRNSIRSARSFPAARRDDSTSNVSDAEDDDGPVARPRRASISSKGSRRRKEGAAASGEETPRKKERRPSYVREPLDSDGERRSLRSNKSNTLFDDRDEDDDVSLTDKRPRSKSNIKLTPVERHYLNKALLCLQMQREWSALANIGELALYGDPFLPHPTGPRSRPDAGEAEKSSLFSALPLLGGGKKAATPTKMQSSQWDKPVEPPVLRYLYWRFIKNFPGLEKAKDDYWQVRIQPFFDSFAERNLSVTRERGEVTKRRLLAMGFTRILGTYFGAGITPLGDAAPSRPDAALMRRVDNLFPGSMQSMFRVLLGKKHTNTDKPRYNAWVGIPESDDDVYTIITRVLAAEDRPVFIVQRSFDEFRSFADKLERADEYNALGLPLLPFANSTRDIPDRLSLQRWMRTVVILLSNPPERARDSTGLSKARISLERFMLDKPERESERRQRDLLNIARKDDDRLEQEREAWHTAGKRARELRTTWAMYRDALIGARELDKSWALVTRFERIKDLPRLHRDAVQWASLWVAYTLHYLYKTSPQAEDLFNLTKGFHNVIPYGLFKMGLRIANPTLMIKTMVNIVLGQPMGQPSLFQRIFGLVMGSEIKRRKKDCEVFRQSIMDRHICDVIEAYVYAPRGTQEHVRHTSYELDEDIVITILREGDIDENTLNDVQDWHEAYLDSGLTTNDAFAEGGRKKRLNEDARRYLQLKGFLRALCIQRDREQVLEIVDEPNTPSLLKASIAVFYKGIYEVAEACNLADRLGDLQAFLQDLVDTVDRGETDTADFIKLAARHEQSLYYFIHEMFAYGGPMMDPIKEWCRSGLTLLKVGLPDREKSGRDTRRLGADVDSIMREVDGSTQDAILKEIHGLMQWTRLRKVQNDIWLRCDLITIDPKATLSVRATDAVLQFTEEEREAVDYIESARGGMRSEGGVAWAWFAEQDILENGSDIRNDWRKAAQESVANLAENKKKKQKKGKKSGPQSSGIEAGTNLPPPPRLLATKTLVEPWIDSLRRSLKAAKDNKVR